MPEAAPARQAVISVNQLRRVFKSRKSSVEAVAGIDLEVFAGEIFGFLGPNGAGKTTTLRMLATLLPPTSGEAKVVGHDLRRQPGEVRRRIGYVGQRGGADLEITGRHELVFEGRLYGLSLAESRQRSAELIDTLELESCADRKISTYSGGQRRRLDIGVGLVHRPQLLFLDEPTTGLDPQSRARMWEEVRKLRDEGTTVFLTTHYLEEADALCNRLAIIDHGRIVAQGTPNELKRAVAGDLVTVGVDGDLEEALRLLRSQGFVREAAIEGEELRLYVDRGETATPDILRLLDTAGLRLTTLALSRPSLDDVFLRSTGRSLRESDAA
ncbi:MAG TPA: ATP-binding cassette domain-containing protein [Candidatus Dormibacteraeota bacterium]